MMLKMTMAGGRQSWRDEELRGRVKDARVHIAHGAVRETLDHPAGQPAEVLQLALLAVVAVCKVPHPLFRE
jgi:hypothetical protein